MSTDTPSSSTSGSVSFRTSGLWEVPTLEAMQAMLPKYQFLGLIGHGGMGAVYKGRQASLDRIVAIKILALRASDADASFSERFKNEARAMARLNHPGIVSVYESGETTNGRLYFVMEHVEGADVAQMLKAQGFLSPEQAAAITAHVCDALQYAHSHGVIHRDIKPANVLISTDGQVKVADFGIAKFGNPAGQTLLTATGVAMGTPDYVAPEAVLAGQQVDRRADLYSTGVMLYHMLTGEIPRGLFEMPSVRGGGLDQRFDGIVAKAMQTNRESRYQTAAEMRAALDAISTTRRVDTAAAVPVLASAVARLSENRPGIDGPGTNGQPGRRSKLVLMTGLGITAMIIMGWIAMTWLEKGHVNHPSPFAALPAARWLPVITDPAKVLNSPHSAFKDGWYRNISASVRGPFRDSALRTRVRYAASGYVKLRLRGELKTGTRLTGYEVEIHPAEPNTIRLTRIAVGPDNHMIENESRRLGEWRMPKALQAGDEFDLMFAVAETELAVWFNGGRVLDTHDQALKEGYIYIGANSTAVEFQDIQWCDLSQKAMPSTSSVPNTR